MQVRSLLLCTHKEDCRLTCITNYVILVINCSESLDAIRVNFDRSHTEGSVSWIATNKPPTASKEVAAARPTPNSSSTTGGAEAACSTPRFSGTRMLSRSGTVSILASKSDCRLRPVPGVMLEKERAEARSLGYCKTPVQVRILSHSRRPMPSHTWHGPVQPRKRKLS